MSLPRADIAVVEPAKIRDYLLSTTHPVGRFKAVFFVALGYSREQWEVLGNDLLALARTETAAPGELSPHGRKFELNGILTGPSGRSATIGTAWIVRAGEEFPRFITAYPR